MPDKIVHIVPDKSDLTISTSNILKSLGMEVKQADQYLLDKIDLFEQECLDLSAPAVCYITLSATHFRFSTNTLLAGQHQFRLGKVITSGLAGSDNLVFFIGTCGRAVEEYASQLMNQGHLLEGLICDLIGSEIAEATAEYIHNTILKKAEETNYAITNRYSPGYCGWPVSDQQKLFALVPGSSIGVQLTAASLMLPVKSVSGLIGIGSRVRFNDYQCPTCRKKNCPYRGMTN